MTSTGGRDGRIAILSGRKAIVQRILGQGIPAHSPARLAEKTFFVPARVLATVWGERRSHRWRAPSSDIAG